MKETSKVWNRRQLVLELGLVGIAIFNLVFKMTVPVLAIVSLLVMLIVLIACLKIKSVKATDVIQSPVVLIKENISETSIDYDIKGITNKEVDEALRKLTDWKEENNFNWISKRDYEIWVTYNPDGSICVEDFKVKTKNEEGKTNEIREYMGKFSYYMHSGNRMLKIDDIQLGHPSLGCIENIEEVNNKNCYIKIADENIIDYKVLEV